ncbi:MAG: Bax inhibitor-1 family protein, partial [Acidimicrobiales bacterium]
MLGGWITTQATMDLDNPSRQYAGLFGQAALYAVLFAPMLYWVFEVKNSAGEVWGAALITAIGFAGLSVIAWVTRRDLSFLRPIVMWGVMAA